MGAIHGLAGEFCEWHRATPDRAQQRRNSSGSAEFGTNV